MQNEKIHKRGRYSAEFKENVALEALTGAKTHAQIASEYGISPDLVKDWKKQAKEMLGWSMGRNMDVGLCLKALEMALGSGCRPGILNTDQGSQYTSEEWQSTILSEGIQISMDGKGRWADNIIMERFWRTYKHEFFLNREPRNLEEAIIMTAEWLEYYNKERPHSSLGNLSPQMYRDEAATPMAANFWCDFFAPAQLAGYAPRPRFARAATPTLQNRTKNGLTSGDTE